MKKIELYVGTLASLSLLMKLMLIPGDGFLSTVTFISLSFFYYLSFAYLNNVELKNILKKSSYKHTNPKRIIASVILGFGFTEILLGSLFKLQLWGWGLIWGVWGWGTIHLLIGLIATGVVSVLSIIHYYRNRTKFHRILFNRIALIGGFGLLVFFTPLKTLVDIEYRHQPEINKLYKHAIENPNNRELKKKIIRKKSKQNVR